MNHEPVKFLPLESVAPADRSDSLYQQNLNIRIALDQSRDLCQLLIWMASMGWIIALGLLFNDLLR